MAQWWQRSPPTYVSRVRFPDPAPYVNWVCCWFSSLLRDVFLRVLEFSHLLKNQHFQIPILAWKVSPISAKALATFYTQISNGNRTEWSQEPITLWWSTIRSVIFWVTTKSYYQLIIKITISEKRRIPRYEKEKFALKVFILFQCWLKPRLWLVDLNYSLNVIGYYYYYYYYYYY